jgi:hypothetical protein
MECALTNFDIALSAVVLWLCFLSFLLPPRVNGFGVRSSSSICGYPCFCCLCLLVTITRTARSSHSQLLARSVLAMLQGSRVPLRSNMRLIMSCVHLKLLKAVPDEKGNDASNSKRHDRCD